MKVIFSHPTGNSNVRALARALAGAGMLERFYTCVAVFEGSFFYGLLRGPFREFKRRNFAPDLKPYIHTRPYRELGRVVSQRFNWQIRLVHEKGMFCIDQVYRDLDQYVSQRLLPGNAVYAYEDGALDTFRKAKTLGIPCFYDLPIGYWRAMKNALHEELEQRPQWALTLTNLKDSPEKLDRKDEEIRMADHIFVASTFTAESLQRFPGRLPAIHVVPYGFPKVRENRSYTPVTGRRIKVLFVGALSQRKGISYMFEAIDTLRDEVDLTVVGQKPAGGCAILDEKLRHCHWIPSLPQPEILQLMRSHDLLIFPSLFEGFGLVITEAMSQGTPVLTTERTCGPDLIRNGENGWIVKAGSLEGLTRKLKEIIHDPACLEKVGKAAMETARNRPWRIYGEEMIRIIGRVLAKEPVEV